MITKETLCRIQDKVADFYFTENIKEIYNLTYEEKVGKNILGIKAYIWKIAQNIIDCFECHFLRMYINGFYSIDFVKFIVDYFRSYGFKINWEIRNDKIYIIEFNWNR